MSRSDAKRLVLVTGATGAVGPSVVNALHEAGYSVRTFSADKEALRNIFPESVEQLSGDINNATQLQVALAGVSALVHLAALLHIDNPDRSLRERYRLINVEGTRLVTSVAQTRGVERMVLFSTVNVYGSTRGEPVSEESQLKPGTFYAETKKEAEEIVLSATRGVDRFGTVLRLGAVYGARVKGNYWRLAHAVARRRFIPLAGTNRRTVIYDRDVGQAVVAVLENPATVGRIYNVTDGAVHTVREILQAICMALNRPIQTFFFPTLPVRWAVTFATSLTNTLGLPPLTPVLLLQKYFEDVAVDGSRLQRETAFRPMYDLERGWRETILQMRLAGDL